ncbi:hypothetical protein RE6C_01996 [Rhodopirellula europaea 6C]|uniref:Uncharacterized protein n=1 Tax=Rhodopirellula europaea 6C TaxID=1263867 RepID=M2B6V9_9BACT|nr:hypothetical protein RE6C_01996 [Rhodopirellula europaea 6C]
MAVVGFRAGGGDLILGECVCCCGCGTVTASDVGEDSFHKFRKASLENFGLGPFNERRLG